MIDMRGEEGLLAWMKVFRVKGERQGGGEEEGGEDEGGRITPLPSATNLIGQHLKGTLLVEWFIVFG